MTRPFPLAAALLLAATFSITTAHAATYALTRTAIAGGGLHPAGAGSYTLTATLSQSAAGVLAGGAYTLSAGFLHPRSLPSVDAPAAAAAPLRVAFLPVRPNPARGALAFAFELPGETDVTLDVLSVDGRRVATPLARRMGAGRHALSWSGSDDAGRRLPPGLYLASLTTSSSRSTQRLVLLDR